VLRELADFCDYLVMLSEGRLAECGPLSGANGILAKYGDEASGGRRYVLKVLRDAPRLELFLAGCAEVSNLKRRDQTIAFDLAGDEEAGAGLLSRVTAAGFQIARFAPEDIDLESVYRKVSGGKAEG
jgi:ABC-type multidrug transport system ATPase subunit